MRSKGGKWSSECGGAEENRKNEIKKKAKKFEGRKAKQENRNKRISEQ